MMVEKVMAKIRVQLQIRDQSMPVYPDLDQEDLVLWAKVVQWVLVDRWVQVVQWASMDQEGLVVR